MKFKIVEGKKLGYKATIKIDGTNIPVEVFYQAETYDNFDKIVKSVYKGFKGYVKFPRRHYGEK